MVEPGERRGHKSLQALATLGLKIVWSILYHGRLCTLKRRMIGPPRADMAGVTIVQVGMCTDDMPASLRMYNEAFGFLNAGSNALWVMSNIRGWISEAT